MKPKVPSFSFQKRASEKAAARANDEEKLQSGQVSPAVMARVNGGNLHAVRYKGPSKRIQAMAEHTEPWFNEPDYLDLTASGYDCRIKRQRFGVLHAYIQIPNDHPLSGSDLEDLHGIQVHNGWTYSGQGTHATVDGGGWTLGFNCNHPDDWAPYGRDSANSVGAVYRDIHFVRSEIERVAAVLAGMTAHD